MSTQTINHNKSLAACRENARLYRQLTEWIHQSGGWVCSIPLSPTLRFQSIVSSTLADVLASIGYRVSYCGNETRIVAGSIKEELRNAKGEVYQTITHSGFCPVSVYEIHLPHSKPPEPASANAGAHRAAGRYPIG